jgi:hypothetical protein
VVIIFAFLDLEKNFSFSDSLLGGKKRVGNARMWDFTKVKRKIKKDCSPNFFIRNFMRHFLGRNSMPRLSQNGFRDLNQKICWWYEKQCAKISRLAIFGTHTIFQSKKR